MSAYHFNYDLCEPVKLPVKKSEWKPSVMKILSTSTSPSEIYGQINLPAEITTPSNLGPSTIHVQRVQVQQAISFFYFHTDLFPFWSHFKNHSNKGFLSQDKRTLCDNDLKVLKCLLLLLFCSFLCLRSTIGGMYLCKRACNDMWISGCLVKLCPVLYP